MRLCCNTSHPRPPSGKPDLQAPGATESHIVGGQPHARSARLAVELPWVVSLNRVTSVGAAWPHHFCAVFHDATFSTS
jgi:hypothetical protein